MLFFTLIFLFSTLVQLFFWLGIFSRLAFYPEKEEVNSPKPEAPISVVICAKNEAENLEKNLPFFLNQDHDNYEVIVVNDNSFDKTWSVLLKFQTKYPILHPVNLIEQSQPGKKTALTRGIQEAHHEIIILSDADCRPASSGWLRKMQSALRNDKEIVLGFSPFEKEKGWLNRFARFETIYTAIQYLSFYLVGFPYMGVGRNLLYRKSLFYRHNGFKKHMDLASGDDDLFINQAANKENTTININPEAFVFSKAKSSWTGYYNQKSRHLTTGMRYRRLHQLLLGALSASHFLHYVCAFILLVGYGACAIVALGYLVRTIVVSCCYARILKRFQDKELLRWVLILDALFVGYYLLFAPVFLTGNLTRKWK